MKGLKDTADYYLRKLSPSWRAKRKYAAELDYWKGEFTHLYDWFETGKRDWWGIRAPNEDQKEKVSDLWAVNAIMTMHNMRPSYTEELRIEKDHFVGKRVLEVGCGPLAPVLQFRNCHRYCLDPLVNLYMSAGWPLYDYDAKFFKAYGEAMPFADGYFDDVISVNALDHVDDFGKVAAEIQRVLKPGGTICFEVEYHDPTETEPLQLDDAKVEEAFSQCDMKLVVARSGREMFEALVSRFNLVPNQFQRFREERFATWHGRKREAAERPRSFVARAGG